MHLDLLIACNDFLVIRLKFAISSSNSSCSRILGHWRRRRIARDGFLDVRSDFFILDPLFFSHGQTFSKMVKLVFDYGQTCSTKVKINRNRSIRRSTLFVCFLFLFLYWHWTGVKFLLSDGGMRVISGFQFLFFFFNWKKKKGLFFFW